VQQTATAWANVKATGGMFRGTQWNGMKAQYTRKIDGATVPAWGGVKRVSHGVRKVGYIEKMRKEGIGIKTRYERMSRVTGNVQGKKRPSGRRVSTSSTMMQDTGSMRNSVLAAPLTLTPQILEIDSKGMAERYADEQNKRRPFVFWTPGDEEDFNAILQRRTDEAVATFNEGREQ
jgi:hypothetical protein